MAQDTVKAMETDWEQGKMSEFVRNALDIILTDTARVLRSGARLVLIEPTAAGVLSQVIAVVAVETKIRGAAQRAMDQTTALVQIKQYEYARTDRYVDFDGFCNVLTAVDPARVMQITAHKDDLRRTFEAHAGQDEKGWTLSQPMSVPVFQPA